MGTQYADRFVQQYCSKGKISVEIIKDLHIYVRELLHEFSHLSNKLVFYRAGVDDGSFQKVLDNEVRAIQRACKGTVVGTDIISPNGFDCYLNSSMYKSCVCSSTSSLCDTLRISWSKP
ncbi:unnamed protein product [Rotaria magnacalcarata]|uniref:Piwi domain-containing protein n=1 Tax=Rotaria magnacalcarata TaxID=392030 RepID=A0A816VTE0_9BILA|nr:unnamed protein product [Rotaria magnacalcarata]